MPAAPTLRGRLAVDQLVASGYFPFVTNFIVDGDGCRGVFSQTARLALAADTRFQSGPFSLLHPDIPEPRRDYRAIKGTFGRGSLQLVVCDTTGEFWCDVDRFSAYQDVVNQIGHLFGEVIPWPWKKKRKDLYA